eukprot:625111-Alexandrium_andersonii.AAC.1
MAKIGAGQTPSWTRLRSRHRQRAEQSSKKPGICPKLETPNRRAQPWWRRASRGAPRAGC